MKANAPEKLYLSKNIYSTYLYQVPDPDDDTAIEYTRTDAFIEKACKWLEFGDFFIENYLIDDVDGNPDFQYEKFINDFRKAMEDAK